MTLLDFLTRALILKFPHVVAVAEDLKHVKEASKGKAWPCSILTELWNILKKGLIFDCMVRERELTHTSIGAGNDIGIDRGSLTDK